MVSPDVEFVFLTHFLVNLMHTNIVGQADRAERGEQIIGGGKKAMARNVWPRRLRAKSPF